MSIKINNTTVIDDSKKLLNITNLKTLSGNSIINDPPVTNIPSPMPAAGTIIASMSNTPPSGEWLSCDGSIYLKSAYPALANAIGSITASTNSSVPIFTRTTDFSESAWSPNGIYMAELRSNVLTIWKDVGNTLQVLVEKTLPNVNYNIDSWSPDSNTIVLNGGGLSPIFFKKSEDSFNQYDPVPAGFSGKYYDITTGEFYTAFSPDNKYLAISAKSSVSLQTGIVTDTITNPTTIPQTYTYGFGASMATYNNTLVISAWNQSTGPGTTGSGAVYVYNTTNNALKYTLLNPNAFGTANYDDFGWSVAVGSEFIVVGTPDEDPGGNSGAGVVYVYSASTGSFVRTLNPGLPVDSWFGNSVATYGNYVVVGAPQIGSQSGGKVFVYNGSTGALLYTLNNPNAYGTAFNDMFGNEVSISSDSAGTTYIAAAAYEEDDGQLDSGKVYLFNIATGALVRTISNPNMYGTSASDNFGFVLASSPNNSYLAIAAYNENQKSVGGTSGVVYVYNVGTGALVYTLTNPFSSNYSKIGWSVSVGDNYLALSSVNESAGGAVAVYKLSDGSIVHRIYNPNSDSSTYTGDDRFGAAVSVVGGNVYITDFNVGKVLQYNIVNSNGSTESQYYLTTNIALYTLRTDGKYDKQPSLEPTKVSTRYGRMAWSPDGSLLAVVKPESLEATPLVTYRLVNDTIQLLKEYTIGDLLPEDKSLIAAIEFDGLAWSNDSKHLVLDSRDSYNYVKYFLYRRDQNGQLSLLHRDSESHTSRPTFSLDSRLIYVVSGMTSGLTAVKIPETINDYAAIVSQSTSLIRSSLLSPNGSTVSPSGKYAFLASDEYYVTIPNGAKLTSVYKLFDYDINTSFKIPNFNKGYDYGMLKYYYIKT
jgi:hypothetical protein